MRIKHNFEMNRASHFSQPKASLCLVKQRSSFNQFLLADSKDQILNKLEDLPTEKKKNVETTIRSMTGKNKISVKGLAQMNRISDLISMCKTNGVTEESNNGSILSIKQIKSKLVTKDSLLQDKMQISNIEKEFQKLSVNNATFLQAISKAQEKFRDNQEAVLEEGFAQKVFQDEMKNTKNDQENFLDPKKLEKDKNEMSRIVVMNRVGISGG